MARSKGIPPTVANFLLVLDSKLTQYDQRMSKKERHPNIYRLGHYLKASGNVKEAVLSIATGNELMSPGVAHEMVASMSHEFTPDFPPAKNVVKQLNAYLESGKQPSLIG